MIAVSRSLKRGGDHQGAGGSVPRVGRIVSIDGHLDLVTGSNFDNPGVDNGIAVAPLAVAIGAGGQVVDDVEPAALGHGDGQGTSLFSGPGVVVTLAASLDLSGVLADDQLSRIVHGAGGLSKADSIGSSSLALVHDLHGSQRPEGAGHTIDGDNAVLSSVLGLTVNNSEIALAGDGHVQGAVEAQVALDSLASGSFNACAFGRDVNDVLFGVQQLIASGAVNIAVAVFHDCFAFNVCGHSVAQVPPAGQPTVLDPALSLTDVGDDLVQVIGHGVVVANGSVLQQRVGVVISCNNIAVRVVLIIPRTAAAQHASNADAGMSEVDNDQLIIVVIEAVVAQHQIIANGSAVNGAPVHIVGAGGVGVHVGGGLDGGILVLTGLRDSQSAGLDAFNSDDNALTDRSDVASHRTGHIFGGEGIPKCRAGAKTDFCSTIGSDGIHTGFIGAELIDGGLDFRQQGEVILAQSQRSVVIHAVRTSLRSQCGSCQAADHAQGKNHSQQPLGCLHWNLFLSKIFAPGQPGLSTK